MNNHRTARVGADRYSFTVVGLHLRLDTTFGELSPYE